MSLFLSLLALIALVSFCRSEGESRRPNGSCNRVVNVQVSDQCCSADIASLQEAVAKLNSTLKKLLPNKSVDQNENGPDVYPVKNIDGSRWRPFWWFKAGTPWPTGASDVLRDEYEVCKTSAPYCFGRLPSPLTEDLSEMLGEDSAGNIYRWKFNSKNSVAHATWRALHDHATVKVLNGNPWMPKVIQGQGPTRTQDCVQYRMEHGVRSLIVDDDGCDCLTSLSMGHGICGDSFSTSYGPENVFGVDILYDPSCQTPTSQNGLTLYFKDDDDCTNVTCPVGTSCRDLIYSYTCQ